MVLLGFVAVHALTPRGRAYDAESVGFSQSFRMRKVDRASRFFDAFVPATRESPQRVSWCGGDGSNHPAESLPLSARFDVSVFRGPHKLEVTAVEHHPNREVLRELVVAVRRMRRGEHHIARADHGFAAAPAIARGARCDDVEFIAIIRHLRAGGWPCREADPDVAVAKHLGGAATLGRRRRAILALACDPSTISLGGPRLSPRRDKVRHGRSGVMLGFSLTPRTATDGPRGRA
jgi:hypothetical protein